MLDLASRALILAGAVALGIRSLYLSRRMKRVGRKVSLLASLPAAITMAIFEIDILFHVPILTGTISRQAWISRLVLVFVLTHWVVMQQMMIYSERAERTAKRLGG